MENIRAGIGFWEMWETLVSQKIAESKQEELLRRSRAVFDEIWARRYDQEVRLFPGVAELLTHLQRSGVKMGLVTSSFYAKKANLFGQSPLNRQELFQAIITNEDTVKKKPDPEPLLRCLEQMDLGLAKESCLCIGDSPSDIIAGRDGAMQTVGVLTGVGTRQNLSKEGADLIVDDVTRLEQFMNI